MIRELSSQSQILVVHDGHTGHLNPSLAIGEILEQQFRNSYETLKVPVNLGNSMVSLLKRLSWFPRLFRVMAKLIFGAAPVHIAQYRLIVCSGMSNLLYSAYLSQEFDIPLAFSGDIGSFNEHLIHWTISALAQPTQVEQIILPTLPVRKKFIELRAQPHCGEASLLLGGPTHEYPFTQADYLNIIRHFDFFVQAYNIQGYIVCSRRTPAFNSRIKKYLKTSALKFVSINDTTPIEHLVARSKYIFVTEDSSTMLSEAIQSGRIVRSVCLNPEHNNLLIEKYLHNHLIQRQPANQPFYTDERFPYIADLDLIRPLGSHFRNYLLFDDHYAPYDLRRKFA